MPNIKTVLQDEITRLSRKELRKAFVPIRTQNSRLRRDVAALKRAVAELTARCKKLEKGVPSRPVRAKAGGQLEASATRMRPTGKMIKALRERLGLSQRELSVLVGVTPQAVYLWERGNGRLRLRTATLGQLAAVKKMGKRDARKLLEAAE